MNIPCKVSFSVQSVNGWMLQRRVRQYFRQINVLRLWAVCVVVRDKRRWKHQHYAILNGEYRE